MGPPFVVSKTMRPQSCKSKGRRLQQRVVADILKAFPHLRADDCVSTPMGAPGEDVRLSPAARECLNLSFECKNTEKINIWSCLEQCETNTPDGVTPCLVFSRNRSNTYAVVPWSALLELCRAVGDLGAVPPRVRTLVRELASLVDPPGSE